MSSFIGFYGRNERLSRQISALAGSSVFNVASGNIFVAGSGHPDRLIHHYNIEQRTGWAVSGIGLDAGLPFKWLRKKDWAEKIHQPKEEILRLNGHFAAMRFSGNEIEFFTDAIGMRSLFFAQIDETHLFSTRFDWLLELLPQKTMNWETFGSYWNAINSFSGNSFIREIKRLKSSGYARFAAGKAQFNSVPFSMPQSGTLSIDFKTALTSICTTLGDKDQPVSLGLSGGLDSRLLFAMLLHQNSVPINLYTFSANHHPDEGAARLLNSSYQKPHTFPEVPKLRVEAALKELPALTGRTMLTSGLSSLPVVEAYRILGNQHLKTIDGGMGEIGRRRFLRSVELKKKKALTPKDARDLLPYLRENNASIFVSEIQQQMENGMLEDLQHIIDSMPDEGKIGWPNWLDLFSIRTRYPNMAGLRQEQTDEYITHLMPFSQPALLHQILQLPLYERRNARLFRRLIHSNAPELTKFPLVKGSDWYPYKLKDLPAMAWITTKRKLGLGYFDDGQASWFFDFEEYVRDTFTSAFLVSSGIYDPKKVLDLIEGFYRNNETTKASEINWLINFESFRKKWPG